ncbi:MAG TPA: TonB-dependent receptor plug domain-containing protein [Candidatus Cryptobacteroides intestinipullorum]|nr:TonB-dependent receptor plug domain-containing protein [Candidatus Cryptobacteroides intestinipullorum]
MLGHLLTVILTLSVPELQTGTAADSIVSAQVTSSAVFPDARVIGEKTISSLPVSSAADILRYASSLQLKDYGGLGGMKTVNIRSLGSQHTSVFIDGIRLGNVQNGQTDLGRYSAEDLQSVTMYSSQTSSLLASASEISASSAVLLATRQPDFSEPFSVKSSLTYGSFTSPAAYCSYSRRLSPELYLKLIGDVKSTRGNYPFTYVNAAGADTTETRKNSDLFSWHLESSLYYTHSNHNLSAKIYWYSSGRGLPGPVIRQAGQFRNGDRQWDRNLFAQAQYSYTKPSFGVKIRGKYADDRCRYLQDTTDNQAVRFLDQHFRQREAYLSVSSFYKYGNFSAAGSWDGIFTRLDTDVPEFRPAQRFSSLVSLRAVYTSGNFSVNGSATYNHTSGNQSPTYDKISPFISIRWNIRDFSLLLWYKNSFRLPTFNDLYYSSSPNLNSSLKPETAGQYNLTVSHSLSADIFSGSASVSLWYNRIKDKITGIPSANQFKWSVMNFGLVRAYGISLTSENTFDIRNIALSVLLNYDFNVSRDFTDPESMWYKGLLPYSPKHSFSASASLGFGKWDFSVCCICSSARYRSVANTAANRLEPYAECDIVISRDILGWLKAKVELCNVTDSKYEIVSRYPLPGFNFKAGLMFDF